MHTCETCGLWVRWNSPDAARGECCLPMTPNAPVKVDSFGVDGPKCLRTSWDFGCVRWIERRDVATSEAKGGEL